MISYDILQVPETGASSSTTPVGRSPRMVPVKAGATKPATAPAPAPNKSKGKGSKLTVAAPAAASAPVAPAEGAAAAEGGADEDMEALAALEGGNPSGEEPTNLDVVAAVDAQPALPPKRSRGGKK